MLSGYGSSIMELVKKEFTLSEEEVRKILRSVVTPP